MFEVGADGVGHAAVAERGERLLFPLGSLPAVDGELGDGAGVGGGVREAATGADRGHLVVVADEQHAAAPTGGDVDDGLEGADVGHAGFVDDEQGVGVERFEAALDVAEQGAGCGPGCRRRR